MFGLVKNFKNMSYTKIKEFNSTNGLIIRHVLKKIHELVIDHGQEKEENLSCFFYHSAKQEKTILKNDNF